MQWRRIWFCNQCYSHHSLQVLPCSLTDLWMKFLRLHLSKLSTCSWFLEDFHRNLGYFNVLSHWSNVLQKWVLLIWWKLFRQYKAWQLFSDCQRWIFWLPLWIALKYINYSSVTLINFFRKIISERATLQSPFEAISFLQNFLKLAKLLFGK